jgi:hypothetical protein
MILRPLQACCFYMCSTGHWYLQLALAPVVVFAIGVQTCSAFQLCAAQTGPGPKSSPADAGALVCPVPSATRPRRRICQQGLRPRREDKAASVGGQFPLCHYSGGAFCFLRRLTHLFPDFLAGHFEQAIKRAIGFVSDHLESFFQVSVHRTELIGRRHSNPHNFWRKVGATDYEKIILGPGKNTDGLCALPSLG